ncbi:hypothetical protein RD792_000778 [Penstemon davidsonii]|uniref:Peptidase A1 domain-containing protein n=1 Tax=Penstemon davidsonii TaxID=160366 RepID=A0ABR0DMM6_9LAMI|nr:hypothetical protein RD792_000778 [Penstemon davidsonii]
MSAMLLPRCTSNQSLDTENMQPALSNQGGHRVIFDIMGDLYPRGLFFAAIKIGKSPDRTYHLDLDTGSDLTWVQCEALHSPYKPHNNFIPKTDPYCSSGSSFSSNQLQRDRCEYRVEYKTGLSHGWLVRDTFSLQDASKKILNPSLVFGCGIYESRDKHEFKIDGVLGLGKSKLAIPTQLKDHRFIENIHGHCLGRQGKGYGFFGRGSRVQIDNALWLKMQPNEKHYVVGPAKLILDQKSPPIKDLSLIFDSGSTYTYFNTPSYHAIYSMVMHILKEDKLSLVKDPFLPVCWKHAKPFNEVKNNFSPVKLDFSEGKVILLQPGDYLITSVPHSLYKPNRNLITCEDPMCASLHGPGNHHCPEPHGQCDYEVNYVDYGSSLGVLVNDSFTLRLTNNSVVAPHLAFGCGHDQEVADLAHLPYTDGVIGLVIGKISILAQLHSIGVTRNIVGHCLSGQGGGFLFFGKGQKPFKSIHDAVNYFKPLALSFPNSKNVQFQLLPEAYLIVTVHGNVCLGILNGGEVGLGRLNVIGDISFQDKLVIYDNERQQFGWTPSNCNELPKLS